MPRAKIMYDRNLYAMKIEGLTKGEMLSIQNALHVYGAISPVALDVKGYVNAAIDDFNSLAPPAARID